MGDGAHSSCALCHMPDGIKPTGMIPSTRLAYYRLLGGRDGTEGHIHKKNQFEDMELAKQARKKFP